MSDQTHKVSYSLSCDELRLFVEFSLRPGVFGRIGSAPEMEISLPLLGLAAEECRLSMDEAGLVWFKRAGEESPIRIDPPSYFRLGPYRFLIREVIPSGLPATESHSSPKDHEKNRLPVILLGKPAIITATAFGLVLLIITTWFATNSPAKSPFDKEANVPAPQLPEGIRPNAVEPSPPASKETNLSQVAPQTTKKEHPPEQPIISKNETTLLRPEQMDLEKLASTVGPCVFLVQVSDARGIITSTGTGFSVTSDGLVATNHHVIKQGSSFALVTNQGAKYEQVRLVAEEPASDLALLKIEASGLPFLNLAKNSDVQAGKRVAVYGSPQGLTGILSEGIISAPPRNLSEKFVGESLPNKGVLIQTTAPVSPGSSGSPLLDREGKVIGIMTLILQGTGNPQNLNFAVPAEELDSLMGKAKGGWSIFGLKQVDPAANAPRNSIERDEDRPDDPAIRELLTKMSSGEWVESLKIASTLAEKYPKSHYVHFQRGYCASMLRLDHQAEISYKRAAEIIPADPFTWNNIGVAIRNQKLYAQSLVAFEKSVALKPDYALGWDNILVTNVILANWPKATTALETLAQLDLKIAKERARKMSQFRIPDAHLKRAIADISSKQLENPAGGPPKFRVIGITSGDLLSVRSGPGANFPKIDGIANGNEVFVVGASEMNGSTEWLPIEYGSFSGWVASKFLEIAE